MSNFKIVDRHGAVVHRGLSLAGANDLLEALITARPSIGALKIEPESQQEQPPAARHVPPIITELHSRRAQNLAEAAQAVEPGQERENLQARIGHRNGMQEVVTAAEKAAAEALQRVKRCGAEVERLKGISQAEIDAAAAALAENIKTGAPQDDQSPLGARATEVLDAEARLAAAQTAMRKLDEELQGARRALTTAESDVLTAASIVIKSHMHEIAEELAACWARANELRNFLGSAEHVGLQLNMRQLELVRGPEDQLLRQGPQIAAWKRALTQDADAQFDDQPSNEVTE